MRFAIDYCFWSVLEVRLMKGDCLGQNKDLSIKNK